MLVWRPAPITINTHLLIAVWADAVLREQSLLTWTPRELHLHPMVDRSFFTDIAGLGACTIEFVDDLNRVRVLQPLCVPGPGGVKLIRGRSGR
jgi:hypothetical protein